MLCEGVAGLATFLLPGRLRFLKPVGLRLWPVHATSTGPSSNPTDFGLGHCRSGPLSYGPRTRTPLRARFNLVDLGLGEITHRI